MGEKERQTERECVFVSVSVCTNVINESLRHKYSNVSGLHSDKSQAEKAIADHGHITTWESGFALNHQKHIIQGRIEHKSIIKQFWI